MLLGIWAFAMIGGMAVLWSVLAVAGRQARLEEDEVTCGPKRASQRAA